MKKILLLVVTLLIALTCAVSGVAYAEQTATDYTQSFAYTFTKEFCERFPDRKAGITVNDPLDNPLQKYLSDCIDTAIGSKAEVSFQKFAISEYACGYNIIARLDKKSDKHIIIGAHYDSDGQGANDNASGVAALLMTMKGLSENYDALPCNVVFVLFDGEELGMLGSNYYVMTMSDTEIENTLVMFNLDSIANGDNLYVWCENKHTGLADLITDKSSGVKEKPYANGTYNLNNAIGAGYGYIETPQNSDHTPFRLAGIPTALFFSGAYGVDPWNYAESANPDKNTMNTSADTFANLDKYNQAEFVAKVETTSDVIVKTVGDGNFMQVAQNQRKQLVNLNVLGRALWARLICLGILIIVVVLAVLYFRKLQKRSILGTAEIKSDKVFKTPDAEDIFSFKK